MFEIKTDKQFGLNTPYHWLFNSSDAGIVVTGARTIQSTSSDDIIDCVKNSGNYVEDYLSPEWFETDPTNLVDQIIYNRNNLVIKDWSAGIIVTSAVLCLLKKELDYWKCTYDRRETYIKAEFITYTKEAYYTEYTKSPVVFAWKSFGQRF